MEENPGKDIILVTGATGYVGARLVNALLEKGYRVRATGRSAEKLWARPWANHPGVEIFPADLLDQVSAQKVLRGCRAAYYLVHSMVPGEKDFAGADRRAASNLAAGAGKEGLERIIYLSGLGESSPDLSRHLKSRSETAEILRQGKTPVTVLRAAMIIGSGSASFEILRYLVERLPVMVTPRWVRTLCQPIAIRDALGYLTGVLEKKETLGETYDIGGADVRTYDEIMRLYAEEAGLPKRWVIPVPVLTPRLSSYWIHLITPVPASLARPLAEGLRNPVVCVDRRIRTIIPQDLLDCRGAIREALRKTRAGEIISRWTDAGKMSSPALVLAGDSPWAGGTVFRDERKVRIPAEPARVWAPLIRIGGESGWYYGDWLWRVRGWADRLAGGVGFRGGRRNREELRAGDTVDFWRVLEVRENERLLLKAEMKLPGEAFLEFFIEPCKSGVSILKQTAVFYPRGLGGLLYWYVMFPFHLVIFRGMLRELKKKAETVKDGGL